METGHGAATPRDIRDLCDLYGVTDEAERDRMMALAAEGKQTGLVAVLRPGLFRHLRGTGSRTRRESSTTSPRSSQDSCRRLTTRAPYMRLVSRGSPRQDRRTRRGRMIRQRRLTQDRRCPSRVVLDEAATAPAGGWPAGYGSAARPTHRDVKSAQCDYAGHSLSPSVRIRRWTVLSTSSSSRVPWPVWCMLKDWWDGFYVERPTGYKQVPGRYSNILHYRTESKRNNQTDDGRCAQYQGYATPRSSGGCPDLEYDRVPQDPVYSRLATHLSME